MTPLEELLVKWHDHNLAPEERAELNTWLTTTEGRAQLRRGFAFDASLLEALLAEKARADAREQARAFETTGLSQSDVLEGWLRRTWRASFRMFTSRAASGSPSSPCEERAGRGLRRGEAHKDEPPLPSPLLHPMEEREKSRSLMQPWFTGGRWKWALPVAASLVLLCFFSLMRLKTEALAQIEGSARGVTVLRGGKPISATDSLMLKSGDQIQTSPKAGATMVYLKEPTRIELLPGTRLRLEETNSSKRLELFQGALTGKVAPQPRGQPMLVVTPHAEAIVMGTEFLISVNPQSSRLEVLDGLVQFIDRDDGKSVMVSGGYFAIAAKGVELIARSLLAEPWHSQDIGEVGLAGAARLEDNRCTAKGAGRNTCLTKDQFHFVYQPLDGDGEIVARVVNVETTQPGGKAGVVIRESLKTAAPHAFLFLRPDGNIEFEHRPVVESKTDRLGREAAPFWLRLTRKGEVITAYKSSDGLTWTRAGADRIKMGKRIYVGLGVTSWDNATLATSVFDHVRVLALSR